MKRSRTIALTGVMATTAIVLTACTEESVEIQAYATVDQCVADGLFDRATCGEMLGQAMDIHREAAPRFASSALCEEQFGFGQCQPVQMTAAGDPAPAVPALAVPGESVAEGQPVEGQQQAGGGSFFMPLFMGYMAGRMLGGAAGVPPAMQRQVGGQAYGVQPYYRTADGRFSGVRGEPINVTRNGATMPRSAFSGQLRTPPVATRTQVVQRGGFGGAGRTGTMGG